MTIHWKAVEQYFTVVLFVFQFFFNIENLSHPCCKLLSALMKMIIIFNNNSNYIN